MSVASFLKFIVHTSLFLSPADAQKTLNPMVEYKDSLNLMTQHCQTPELVEQCRAFAWYELSQCPANDKNCILGKLSVIDEYCQALCNPGGAVDLAARTNCTLFNTTTTSFAYNLYADYDDDDYDYGYDCEDCDD